jgi:hypothetical protein
MQNGIDKASLNQWYVLDTEAVIPVGRSQNRLLGTDLTVVKQADGAIEVFAEGRVSVFSGRRWVSPSARFFRCRRLTSLTGAMCPAAS